MSKRPMGGVTLSSQYATSLRDWRREREFRQDAIDISRKDGATEEEILAMPKPRGWWEYAVDPRADGAPTSPNSNELGQLDRSSPLNTDALILQPWWDEASVGHDTQSIMEYQQMLKSEIDNIPSALSYYLDEAWTPDIYVRTSMADYVPSLFNIFTNSDGDRLDPAKTENLFKRTGQTFIQGSVGLGAMGLAGFLALKMMPSVVDSTMEIFEKVVKGTVETTVGALSTLRQEGLRHKMAKKAITGD